MAETTDGSFKTEQINGNRTWRDINAVEVAAFEAVDFFDSVRPHEYLDDLTPIDAEKPHHDHFTALPAAGRNTKPSLGTPREVSLSAEFDDVRAACTAGSWRSGIAYATALNEQNDPAQRWAPPAARASPPAAQQQQPDYHRAHGANRHNPESQCG